MKTIPKRMIMYNDKKIPYAPHPRRQVIEHQATVARIVEAILGKGRGSYVTDDTRIDDFFIICKQEDVPGRLQKLSEALGVPVDRMDYLVDVAKRIEGKEKVNDG